MYMFDELLHRRLKLPYKLSILLDTKRSSRQTVVLLHGLGASAGIWKEVADFIEQDVRVVAVDLLGFGESPKPMWSTYSVQTQVRMLRHTLRRNNIRGRIILAGHSMGSLVAVEYAKRFPREIDHLILCSMPLYTNEAMLALEESAKPHISRRSSAYLRLYKMLRERPAVTTRAAKFTAKYLALGENIALTDENWYAYASSLQTSIERQTTIIDAERLRVPTEVIYGTYDVLIIKKYLKELVTKNPHAHLHRVRAGHQISVDYARVIARLIDKSVRTPLR
jgi:pimeloyl-ACP methyl ester carboxylesterase